MLMSDLIPLAMTSHPTEPGEIAGQIRHTFALLKLLKLWSVPSVSRQGEEASRRQVWDICPPGHPSYSAELKSAYNREVDLISLPVL